MADMLDELKNTAAGFPIIGDFFRKPSEADLMQGNVQVVDPNDPLAPSQILADGTEEVPFRGELSTTGTIRYTSPTRPGESGSVNISIPGDHLSEREEADYERFAVQMVDRAIEQAINKGIYPMRVIISGNDKMFKVMVARLKQYSDAGFNLEIYAGAPGTLGKAIEPENKTSAYLGADRKVKFDALGSEINGLNRSNPLGQGTIQGVLRSALAQHGKLEAARGERALVPKEQQRQQLLRRMIPDLGSDVGEKLATTFSQVIRTSNGELAARYQAISSQVDANNPLKLSDVEYCLGKQQELMKEFRLQWEHYDARIKLLDHESNSILQRQVDALMNVRDNLGNEGQALFNQVIGAQQNQALLAQAQRALVDHFKPLSSDASSPLKPHLADFNKLVLRETAMQGDNTAKRNQLVQKFNKARASAMVSAEAVNQLLHAQQKVLLNQEGAVEDFIAANNHFDRVCSDGALSGTQVNLGSGNLRVDEVSDDRYFSKLRQIDGLNQRNKGVKARIQQAQQGENAGAPQAAAPARAPSLPGRGASNTSVASLSTTGSGSSASQPSQPPARSPFAPS